MKTTIYVKRTILEQLKKKAKKDNITLSELISRLLTSLIRKKISSKSFYHRPIKYQESDSKIGFHRLHVCFSLDQYEVFLDARKFFKSSVSRLLFLAMKALEKNILSFSDKYYIENYFYDKKYYNGHIRLIQKWKIP
ncbi:MAG: hypothetical protein JXK07_10885 [Spirochaetes bacterium]|nr:hypothetical protein [Spirochaetota bacterium]MBN2771098.1 hypothetical protein [Spirochaetota bacterium]